MSSISRKFISGWRKGSPKERTYMIAGALFLVLAIVGIFLPVVPQVPFAIIAGLFFAKGNPRIHRWLRKNKHLGPPVRDWEDHRVLRPKLKVISVVAMVGAAVIGHWHLLLPWAIALDVIFLACIAFVISRRSRPA